MERSDTVASRNQRDGPEAANGAARVETGRVRRTAPFAPLAREGVVVERRPAGRPLSAAGRIGRREEVPVPFRAEEVLSGTPSLPPEHDVVSDALARVELRGSRAESGSAS